MGILAYILGRSGTGKSYSMRNFPADELGVVNVEGKILPFKGSGKIETVNTDKSADIVQTIRDMSKKYKSIVVDDYQYVMANEFMRRAKESGWDKFTDIAKDAWDIADLVRKLPNDVIVYIMCHTDTDSEGFERLKTIGKMLDEKIVLEGMSTIVLKTHVADGKYSFLTQNNGKDTAKSPFGMFPSYAIDNDLKYVDEKIRNYYEIGDYVSDEEMAEKDETVKQEYTEPKKRSRRGGKEKEEKPTEASEEKAKTETADTGSEPESGSEPERPTESERPKRSRRTVSEELESEREEVAKRNAEKVAYSGLDGDGQFDHTETPELEELPRRRRRTVETADKEPEVETPMAITSARRRRTR